MAKGSKSRFVKLFVRILVTAVLLTVVVKRVDLVDLKQSIAGVKLKYLIIVFLLYAFSFWVRSYRFQLILKQLDCSVHTLKIFLASSVTMLYSLVLPGFASTGVKWYILKEHTGEASSVLSSMAYNQISEIAIKVLIGLVAIMFAHPNPSPALLIICAALILAIVLAGALLLNKTTGPPVNRTVRMMFHPFPKIIRQHVDKVFDQLQTFQTAGWRFHANISVVCLVASIIGIYIYIMSAKAAGIHVPCMALAWQCSVVFVLGRLPISIANLGIREMALIEFLAVYGVHKPDALLMSMVIFSGILFMALIGVIYQVIWLFRGRSISRKISDPL